MEKLLVSLSIETGAVDCSVVCKNVLIAQFFNAHGSEIRRRTRGRNCAAQKHFINTVNNFPFLAIFGNASCHRDQRFRRCLFKKSLYFDEPVVVRKENKAAFKNRSEEAKRGGTKMPRNQFTPELETAALFSRRITLSSTPTKRAHTKHVCPCSSSYSGGGGGKTTRNPITN